MSLSIAFLLQIALILAAARLFGEMLRRINQPTVLGELLAGIVLGPSCLGMLWPAGFQHLFGDPQALRPLATVGLVLLMLLTGLETDVRVMRNMGRAAFMASVFGMLIPFASGLFLGTALDDRFVSQHGRPVLALFLATSMAISALPVIAKILMDLNMTRRNFGLVILSAAVVDDTMGWIILALISGLVNTGSLELEQMLQTLALVAAFLGAAYFLVCPFLRWFLPRAEQELHMPHSELVVIVVIAFLFAAATEAMRVHAVFGAFVAGALLRQCSGLRPENVQRLESVTLALFSPLFFGMAGLQVDLTQLRSPWLPAAVLGIAVAGKVAGCFIGGLAGRLPRWEALALGLGMSARGAMGLVVATVGLQLGILNAELFSSLVLMALLTSLLAPLTLKAIAHKLPLSEEEKLREKGAATGFVPAGHLKLLVPVSGGRNALLGCHFSAYLCQTPGDRTTALHIQSERRPWWKRLWRARARAAGTDMDAYFQQVRQICGPFSAQLSLRSVASHESVLATLLAEAAKGCHFLILGGAGRRHPLYDPFISELIKRNPCHVMVFSSRETPAVSPPPFKRILVPTNGGYCADAAFEVAAHYAEAAGAKVTVLYVAEANKFNPLLPVAAVSEMSDHTQDIMKVTLRAQYSEKMKNPKNLDCQIRESPSLISALVEEVEREKYDLVILGAENKSLVERLYLGQHIEAVLTEVPCPVALLIPKVAR